jgi:hypothetical protein
MIVRLLNLRVSMFRAVLDRKSDAVLWHISSVTLVCGPTTLESIAPQAPMRIDDTGVVRASIIGAGGLRICNKPDFCVSLGNSTNFGIDGYDERLDGIKLHDLMNDVPTQLRRCVRVSAFRVMSTILQTAKEQLSEEQTAAASTPDVIQALNSITWAIVIPGVAIHIEAEAKTHKLTCEIRERSLENSLDTHLIRSVSSMMTAPIFNTDPSIRYAKNHPSVTLKTIVGSPDKQPIALPLAQSDRGVICEDDSFRDLLFHQVGNIETFETTQRSHYTVQLSAETSIGMNPVSTRHVNEIIAKQSLPPSLPEVTSHPQATAPTMFSVLADFARNITVQ